MARLKLSRRIFCGPGKVMNKPMHALPPVKATVTEVLPLFGLAYLCGDDEKAWTVTKSTPGAGLEALRPGMRVGLSVSRHNYVSLVSSYEPLDRD
jgi:hypothetical protein